MSVSKEHRIKYERTKFAIAAIIRNQQVQRSRVRSLPEPTYKIKGNKLKYK